jgi:hypothetical protein
MNSTIFDAMIYTPIQTRNLCYSARVYLYIRLVRVFIGAHRQWLSVPQIGGQGIKRITPALERNAYTDLREFIHELDCTLLHVL